MADLSQWQLPASVALVGSPNVFTATQQIGAGATPMTLNSTPGLSIAGSLQVGNLVSDRSLTRGLNVEFGRTILVTDLEDMHGELILGSLNGIGGGATHKQVFGAEIQGQTLNIAGIACDSITGVNALALHMSDQNIAAPRYVAGLVGTAQFGNSGTPTLVATVDRAAGVIGNTLTTFGNPYTIPVAMSVWAKAQTAGTLNLGVYSESHNLTAAGVSVGLGMGLTNGTPGARQTIWDGGTHYGTGAVSNTGVGVVTGLSKLVFANDGNSAPRLFISSNTLFIQYGASGSTIEDGSGNVAVKFAAGAQIGFFGTTPISRPARVGQLVDNSGGASGGNTIAAIANSDATVANAIATLAAKVNALETLWHNYGLTT